MKCPKCESEISESRHIEGVARAMCRPAVYEHLAVTCLECRFTWSEPCADSKKDSDPPWFCKLDGKPTGLRVDKLLRDLFDKISRLEVANDALREASRYKVYFGVKTELDELRVKYDELDGYYELRESTILDVRKEVDRLSTENRRLVLGATDDGARDCALESLANALVLVVETIQSREK